VVSADPGSFLELFYDSVGIDPRQFQYQRDGRGIATGVDSVCRRWKSKLRLLLRRGPPTLEWQWLSTPGLKRSAAPLSQVEARSLCDARGYRTIGRPARAWRCRSRQLDAHARRRSYDASGLSRYTIPRYLSRVSGGGSALARTFVSAYSDLRSRSASSVGEHTWPRVFRWQHRVRRHMVKRCCPPRFPGPATMTRICQVARRPVRRLTSSTPGERGYVCVANGDFS